MTGLTESVFNSALDENILKQLYYIAYLKDSQFPSSFASRSTLTTGLVVDGYTTSINRSSTEASVPILLRANNPIPVYCSIYYFEISVAIKSRSGALAIGLCSAGSSTSKFPGLDSQSWGYHSNTGTIYYGSKDLNVSGPTFDESDVIGCGVNFVTNSIFFTKNGVFMGPIDIGKKISHPLYPCVALACSKCHVTTNFGRHKFTFDIGQYIARERSVVIGTAVDRKCTDQLAHVTMRNLVASYLLHNGYVESANALGRWIQCAQQNDSEQTKQDQDAVINEETTTTNATDHQQQLPNLEPDIREVFNWSESTELLLWRRHLRDTIRQGDYLSALEQLNTHFEQLAEQEPSIAFVLKCHHFISLMCAKATPSNFASGNHLQPATGPVPGVTNGFTNSPAAMITNSRFMPQKRSKPCSSAESSPESVSNGYHHHHHSQFINNGDPIPESEVNHHNNCNSKHHSPSTCQAPIRVRLNTPEHDENNSSQCMEPAQLPVFPPDHQCYAKASHRIRSISSSNDEEISAVTGNGVVPDSQKRDRLTVSNRRFSACLRPNPESCGGGSVQAAVNLIDSGLHSNGISRTKCINIVRRIRPTPPPVVDTTPNSTSSSFCVNHDSNCASDVPSSPSSSSGGTPQQDSKPSLDATHHNCAAAPAPSETTASTNGFGPPPSRSTPPPPPPEFAHTSLAASHTLSSDETPVQTAVCEAGGCPASVNDADMLAMIEYGRSLRATAYELYNRNVLSLSHIQLLNGAFGLIAYQDPYSSPFRKFLDPIHRERLADAVNSAIMVYFNQPANPVLDTALGFLETALTDIIPISSSRRDRLVLVQSQGIDRLRISSPANTIAAQSRIPLVRRNSNPVDRFSNLPLSSTRPPSASFRSTRVRSAASDAAYTLDTPQIEDNSNGSSGLPRPASHSSVPSSIYIPPSALLSFGGSRSTTHPVDCPIQRPVSRPTALIAQLTATSSNLENTPSTTAAATTAFLSPSTPLTPVISQSANTVAWSAAGEAPPLSVARSQRSRQRHSRTHVHATNSANSTAAPTCGLVSHLPVGPELAGFFHPLLFVD